MQSNHWNKSKMRESETDSFGINLELTVCHGHDDSTTEMKQWEVKVNQSKQWLVTVNVVSCCRVVVLRAAKKKQAMNQYNGASRNWRGRWRLKMMERGSRWWLVPFRSKPVLVFGKLSFKFGKFRFQKLEFHQQAKASQHHNGNFQILQINSSSTKVPLKGKMTPTAV